MSILPRMRVDAILPCAERCGFPRLHPHPILWGPPRPEGRWEGMSPWSLGGGKGH